MEKEVKHILETAYRLFNKFGIRSVAMDDIARELGMSKKTLYQYVADKTDLIKQVIMLEYDQKICEFKSFKDDKMNAIEELLQINRHVAKMLAEHNPSFDYDLKKYYPTVHQDINSKRRVFAYESMQENMRKGKQEGLYRPEINDEIICKLPMLRMEGRFLDDFFAFDDLDPVFVSTEIFVYHLYGICSEKGREYLTRRLSELKEAE